MSKRTYLPLLMDRWTAGTQELTFEQRGFYISLLVWMYDTGEAVKDSDHAARILRCDKRTSRRLLAELLPKFRRTSAGLRHKVLDELIRNGGKIRHLGAIDFPLVPDPIRNKRSSNEDLSSAEPKSAPADVPQLPTCPHQKIIDLYHQICPTMRRVRTWQGQRPKFLQARWKEHPNLDWWKGFLAYCAESEFLTGRTNGFCADLEWLIRPNNFQKVNEGKYHGRRESIRQAKPRADEFNPDGTRKRELTH